MAAPTSRAGISVFDADDVRGDTAIAGRVALDGLGTESPAAKRTTDPLPCRLACRMAMSASEATLLYAQGVVANANPTLAERFSSSF